MSQTADATGTTGIVRKAAFIAGMTSTLFVSSLAEDLTLISGVPVGQGTASYLAAGGQGDPADTVPGTFLAVALHDTDALTIPVNARGVIEWHAAVHEGQIREAGQGDGEDPLHQRALALARMTPAVDVAMPRVPDLTDNVVANVQALFGLTADDLAALLGITERQVFRMKRHGVSEDRRRTFDALQAAGLALVGGLGSQGARRWLEAGKPSSRDLVVAGRIDEVAQRARVLTDSPAT